MDSAHIACYILNCQRSINYSSKQKVERDNEQCLKAMTARIFKNKVAIEVNEIERIKEDLKFEDIAELVSGTRGKQVFVKGDPNLGIWTAGQVLGLIDDIPTCHQLVTRMIGEAETIISQRLRNMIV